MLFLKFYQLLTLAYWKHLFIGFTQVNYFALVKDEPAFLYHILRPKVHAVIRDFIFLKKVLITVLISYRSHFKVDLIIICFPIANDLCKHLPFLFLMQTYWKVIKSLRLLSGKLGTFYWEQFENSFPVLHFCLS